MLGSTRQGNSFSGTSCRDVSSVILRILEKKNLGIIIISSHNGEVKKRAAIACVNDTDFYASSVECEKKIQEIATHCAKMYEASGGKVQIEKVSMHSWQ